MPIDPNIALQIKPAQIDDPLTAQTKQLQLRDLMAQEQSRQMQMGAAQRAQQEQATVAKLWQQANGDPQAFRALLAPAGVGHLIPTFDTQQVTQREGAAKANAADFDLAKKKLDAMHAEVSTLLADPELNTQKVINRLGFLVNNKIMSAEDGAALARSLPPDPGRLRNELIQFGLSVMDHKDRLTTMLPKTGQMDLGGQIVPTQTNQLTGQVTQGAPIPKTMTPGEVASNRVARERLEFDKGTGKIPPGYRPTKDGQGLEPIPGGPADYKLQGQFNADQAQLLGANSSLDRLAASANELLKAPGIAGITGLRGAIPNIPGTDAADAQAKLNTLKSQVGFGVLQEMRNNSKTGGALGSVSDAEGKRLEANLASLENAQSLKEFKAALQKIVDYTEQAKTNMASAFNLKHKLAPQGAQLSVPQQPAAAPSTNGWTVQEVK